MRWGKLQRPWDNRVLLPMEWLVYAKDSVLIYFPTALRVVCLGGVPRALLPHIAMS